MVEKLPKIEKSNIKPDSKISLWYSDAIAEIQVGAFLSNEEAGAVLYSRTLSQLKELVAGNKSVLSVFEDNRDAKVQKAIELSIIVTQLLNKDSVNEILKASDSNKFRPIKITADKGDIEREKMAYVEATGGHTMGDMEAQEMAACKKIVEVLLSRLFSGDGAQKLANVFELTDLSPELAADLGKIMQATELIRLYNQHIEKIADQDAARRELIAKAKGKAQSGVNETILYSKELFGGTKYFTEEPKQVFGGYHQRIKELEEKAKRYKTTGETIN